MTRLLVVILDDLSRVPDLLQSWERIGVPGATILSSIGAHSARSWLGKVGLEGLDRLFEAKEVRRKTLLTAIDDDALMDKAIAEAEFVVGCFNRPNTGVLFVLPVMESRGLSKDLKIPAEEPLPPAVRSDWNVLRKKTIEQVEFIHRLEPTLIEPDTFLDEIATAMLTHSNVHVACVIDEDNRLLGLIKLKALVDHLFFHIMPEEFLGEVTDIEDAMAFAEKSRLRRAKDAMDKPVWVKRDETLKEAFKRMHENDLPGLPVVDDYYRVTGYISMLELLDLCTREKSSQPEGGETQ